MQCENCHATLAPSSIVCMQCGAPVPQDIDGFEDTSKIQRLLREAVVRKNINIFEDPDGFSELVEQTIASYPKECKLLKKMIASDTLKKISEEPNQQIAVMKAKSYMVGEVFLSESAAEFVLCCFTYLIGWPYDSTLRKKSEEEIAAEKEKESKLKPDDVDVNAMIFRPSDSSKMKFKGTVEIPDGYTKIDSFCFDSFRFLKNVVLPKSVVAIGDYAFSDCKNLRTIELPEDLMFIGQGAFNHCGKLTMIKLPENVQAIEDNTFSGCRSLEIVDVPDSVTKIGAGAFAGCESLRKIFLPDNVSFIDENVFEGCTHVVIRCYEGSYVQRYCMAYGLQADPILRGFSF